MTKAAEQDECGSELQKEDHQLEISLHAMVGSLKPSTIRLIGTISHQLVNVLLDTGSTHNFIDSSISKKLGLHIIEGRTFDVTIVGGEKLTSTGWCPAIDIKCQGALLKAGFHLISLGGSQLVLGVQWMSILDKLSFDFKTNTTKIKQQGKSWVLKGKKSEPEL